MCGFVIDKDQNKLWVFCVLNKLLMDKQDSIFAEYNQQDAMFLSLFISVRHSTCFRRFFNPSSGAQNCTYSVGICQSYTATCC